MLDPQKEAKKLLETHGINQRPVDVEAVAKKLGAIVVYKDLEDDLCGMIYKEDGQVFIGVNEKHPSTRRRFTLAHEIGHLVMHGHLIDRVHVDREFKEKLHRDGRSKIGEDRLEIDANRFAAELLMPSHLLKVDIRSASIDSENGPTELADLYEVSPQAMSLKLMRIVGDKY